MRLKCGSRHALTDRRARTDRARSRSVRPLSSAIETRAACRSARSKRCVLRNSRFQRQQSARRQITRRRRDDRRQIGQPVVRRRQRLDRLEAAHFRRRLRGLLGGEIRRIGNDQVETLPRHARRTSPKRETTRVPPDPCPRHSPAPAPAHPRCDPPPRHGAAGNACASASAIAPEPVPRSRMLAGGAAPHAATDHAPPAVRFRAAGSARADRL